MKVVLDTNVLVSGLLSPYGPPGLIVRLVATDRLQLCYDAAILSEYWEVLRREKFVFKADRVKALLEHIRCQGFLVTSEPLPKPLADPGDEKFLAAALAGGAAYLITGNTRHYPRRTQLGVEIVTPRQFVENLRTSSET